MSFNVSPETPTRIAMVHRSFRAVSMRRGVTRQRFAAHFPALGLLNLAHSLRVEAAIHNFEAPVCRYFDEESYPDEESLTQAVRAWLAESERRIIAASAYTSTVDYLESFLSSFPPDEYLCVVGGAHASVAPSLTNAHIVVRGEGGAPLRHIVTRFFTPEFGQGADARGLCYRLNGQDVFSPPAFDRSIEILPSPCFAYDLLASQGPIYSTNFTRMLGRNPQIYVCTQSCRARCTFCSTYLIHGRAVARPVTFIREDLHYIVDELHHDSLEFHDDDLLQHPEFPRLLSLMGDVGVPWFCYARVDGIDEHLAAEMADAGCRRTFLGIESMNQQNLDYYNKETTVEQNRKAVEALAAAGISVVAGFIIGAPHDTIDSILHDLDQFLRLPLFAINCSILSPDPGTVEFQRARKQVDAFPVALTGTKNTPLVPNPGVFGIEAPIGFPAVCKNVSKTDLNRLQLLIDVEFYFRTHVWQSLIHERDLTQIGVVSDYYRFLSAEIRGINADKCPPRIAERVQQAIDRVSRGFWVDELRHNCGAPNAH